MTKSHFVTNYLRRTPLSRTTLAPAKKTALSGSGIPPASISASALFLTATTSRD
jgi:hypothetical protein